MSEIETTNDATKEDIANLRDRITALSQRLDKLQRYAPPVAAERARWSRFICEISGLAIVAAGMYWIYPPTSALVVGGWMLADVIASRRATQPKKDRSHA